MKNGGNVDNLVKSDDLTSDELRKRAQRGGLESAAKRQEKKEVEETFELTAKFYNKLIKAKEVLPIPEEIRMFLCNCGKEPTAKTVQMAIHYGQIAKALQQDTAAANYVAKIRGLFRDNNNINIKVDDDITDDEWAAFVRLVLKTNDE